MRVAVFLLREFEPAAFEVLRAEKRDIGTALAGIKQQR
jgi:hypothetical protein